MTIVERLRAGIEALGGEYRFGAKVTDLLIDRAPDGEAGPARRRVRGVVLESGETIAADHVVLAVGHSARETFAMLERRGVVIDAKPFSIGVRIEHPQSLIDRARYGAFAGHKLLGAAEYKLVHHCTGSGAESGRTVYSFCMCPGGTVVAATSEPGRVVTNGMSQYSRNERNANAGLVVGITPEDYADAQAADGVMAGVAYQRHWESRAFAAGGGNYAAPVQLVGDFLAGRPSTRLGSVVPSYRPGVMPTDLALCLPDFAVSALREALPAFARGIAGFAMDDAVLTGVETRTSAPVRIGRGGDFTSLNTQGLYPAGRARAMPAASCRPAWTASRWPRRWRARSSPRPRPGRGADRCAAGAPVAIPCGRRLGWRQAIRPARQAGARQTNAMGMDGMKVGDAIAEIMKREGIDILCGYPVNHLIEYAAKARYQARHGASGTHRAAHGGRDFPAVFRQDHRFVLHAARSRDRERLWRRRSVLWRVGSRAGAADGLSAAASRISTRTSTRPTVSMRVHHQKSAEPINAGEPRCPTSCAAPSPSLRNGRGGPVLVEIPADIWNEEVPERVRLYAPVLADALRAGSGRTCGARPTCWRTASRPVIYAGTGHPLVARAWPQLRSGCRRIAGRHRSVTSLGGKSSLPGEPIRCRWEPAGVAMCANRCRTSCARPIVILGVGCSFTESNRSAVAMPKDKTGDPRDARPRPPQQGSALRRSGCWATRATDPGRAARRPRHQDAARPRRRSPREIASRCAKAWLAKWMPKLTSDAAPLSRRTG